MPAIFGLADHVADDVLGFDHRSLLEIVQHRGGEARTLLGKKGGTLAMPLRPDHAARRSRDLAAFLDRLGMIAWPSAASRMSPEAPRMRQHIVASEHSMIHCPTNPG